MNKFAKKLSLVIALVMIVSVFAACGNDEGGKGGANGNASTKVQVTIPGIGDTSDEAITVNPNLDLVKDSDFADYADWAEYKSALGEYYKYVLAAEQESDVSARYALYAIAEAKLLESGVMLPTTTEGGGYALSRVVPNTANNVLWGNDANRFENLLITTDFIKVEDREALKAKYVELKGTGTFTGWAQDYLSDKGYSFKDTYTIGYSSDPKTWDILATYLAADSEAIINTYDNLVSYDNEGRLVYALAESVTVSEDQTKYTFKLRDGLKWVTSEGEEYAPVKAQDFVDGMQSLLDKAAGLEYLVCGVIENAAEYLGGETTDFTQVGVKAIDDKTLEYTLCQPTPYFMTMLTYNPFAPICKEYADSKGEDYGTTPENILYCGPYLVSSFVSNNKIVFSANPTYWDAENILIKTITWNYYDGKDVTATYNDAKSGKLDGAGLNTTTIPMAKNDSLFDAYAYISGTNATTFSAFANISRGAYETDGYGMESTHTDDQKSATAKALLNQNFRVAIAQAVNRIAYNAASEGEELAANSLRNTLTPGTFVSLTRPVTIKIGGEDKTFAKGTYYGEIVQAQLDADGYSSIKAWDPKGGSNADGSSDGYDGWYNPTAAKEFLDKAIAELKADGLEITKENPIHLDLPYYSASDVYVGRAQAYKQSLEASLDSLVIVDLVATDDIYGWYYAGYYCNTGDECNYDLYDCSGWGPDYGDPATYLNIFKPNGGDLTHVLGVD